MNKLRILFAFLLLHYKATAFADEGKKVLVALGDSITRGFDASKIGDNLGYSWATGTSVTSYWSRLLGEGDGEGEAHNFATFGARSHRLEEQIAKIPEKVIPTDISIMIGANDACRGFKEDTIGNLNKALLSLHEKYPEAKLVVVPVPKIGDVYELKRGKVRCRLTWRAVNACPGFLTKDADLRAENQVKLNDLNERIRQLVITLNEGAFSENNIVYPEAVAERTLLDEDISDIDCFHPSVTGQQKISDTVASY